MKKNLKQIVAMSAFITVFGAGTAVADDRDNNGVDPEGNAKVASFSFSQLACTHFKLLCGSVAKEKAKEDTSKKKENNS